MHDLKLSFESFGDVVGALAYLIGCRALPRNYRFVDVHLVKRRD